MADAHSAVTVWPACTRRSHRGAANASHASDMARMERAGAEGRGAVSQCGIPLGASYSSGKPSYRAWKAAGPAHCSHSAAQWLVGEGRGGPREWGRLRLARYTFTHVLFSVVTMPRKKIAKPSLKGAQVQQSVSECSAVEGGQGGEGARTAAPSAALWGNTSRDPRSIGVCSCTAQRLVPSRGQVIVIAWSPLCAPLSSSPYPSPPVPLLPFLSPTTAPEGQIYISGLPRTVTDDALAAYFGSLGVLKRDKRKGTPMVRRCPPMPPALPRAHAVLVTQVWIYRDGAGEAKGDATGVCACVGWGSTLVRLRV